MLIIGCDFHTRYQQIAMAREETSELAGGADVHLFFPYATHFIVSFLRFFAQSSR